MFFSYFPIPLVPFCIYGPLPGQCPKELLQLRPGVAFAAWKAIKPARPVCLSPVFPIPDRYLRSW